MYPFNRGSRGGPSRFHGGQSFHHGGRYGPRIPRFGRFGSRGPRTTSATNPADANCIIPIQLSKTLRHQQTSKVYHTLPDGTTRREDLPRFDNIKDREELCRTVTCFLKAMMPNALNITDGDTACHLFSKVLSADVDSQWTTIYQQLPSPRTLADFIASITSFLGLFVGSDGIDIQTRYMRDRKSKPYDMSPGDVWVRLQAINNMMLLWPNNPNGTSPPLSSKDLRTIFESLMLPEWVNQAHRLNHRATLEGADMTPILDFYNTVHSQSKQRPVPQQSQHRSPRHFHFQRHRFNPYQVPPYHQPSHFRPPFQQHSSPHSTSFVPRSGPGRGFPPRGGRDQGRGFQSGRGRGVYFAEAPQPATPQDSSSHAASSFEIDPTSDAASSSQEQPYHTHPHDMPPHPWVDDSYFEDYYSSYYGNGHESYHGDY